MREQIVFSKQGYPIGHLEPDRAYWAVKFNDDTWVCEMDQVDARVDKWVTVPDSEGLRSPIDLVSHKRYLDWTLDMVSTGDWARIVELWLICPPTPTSPMGNTARLPISPSGTAFQLKVGTLDSSLSTSLRRCQGHLIGRVTDVETGDCECFVFDYVRQGLVLFPDEHGILGPWKTNIFNIGAWIPSVPGQPSMAPVGKLGFDVLGVRLPQYPTSRPDGDCGCGGSG